MIDTHLIYVALTVFGICAGTAILISVAIIAVAAIMHSRITTHKDQSVRTRRAGHGIRHEPALR